MPSTSVASPTPSPSPTVAVQATPDVDRSLRLSVLDGVMHAVMLGVSESYLGALAVELGHRDMALALLSTVPILMGALTQGLTCVWVRWAGSRQRLIVWGAAGQALAHLAFVAIALFEVRSFGVLLAAKMAFWILGMAIAPAWGSWMATLTQGIDRTRYFARRSMLIYAALLPSFTFAGYALQGGKLNHTIFGVFGALFGVGCLARLLSAYALARKTDPHPPKPHGEPIVARMRAAARATQWRIPITLAIFMMGAHIAMPFFTPYMLKTLSLGYERYALLTAAAFLARALAFPLMRHVTAYMGFKGSLFLCGAGVACTGLLWSHVTTWDGLLGVQVLSGVAWSGVELASFQLLLQSTRDEYHIETLSMAASLSGLLQLVGALTGSLLIRLADFTYQDIFELSGYARALPLVLLLPWLTSPREVTAGAYRMFMRLVSVRPGGGSLREPITGEVVSSELSGGEVGSEPATPSIEAAGS